MGNCHGCANTKRTRTKSRQRTRDAVRMYAADLASPRVMVENATWSNTIPFVPPLTEGKVIKVYDGDTITVATTMPWAANMISERNKVYRFNVRLLGIDAPELRKGSDEERSMGLFVQNALEAMLLNRFVRLENVSIEPKYGRMLAYVFLEPDGLDISQWLLENRMAVPYTGGTKYIPKSWKRYHIGTDLQLIKRT